MPDLSRLVILASGSGTNLQAIIDACKDRTLSAQVCAVVSDKIQAYALQRARDNGIPSIHFDWLPYKQAQKPRAQYDADLAALVKKYQPDLIVLAGWMRLLSMAFLGEFPSRVINLHPALPGTFPGVNAIQQAFQAYQAHEIQETGVMVHYVPDEGVDDGPVILQEAVSIFPSDSLEDLEQRIHQVEHRLLVDAIRKVNEMIKE